MAENPRFIAALDYILNHATPPELDAISGALQRRSNTQGLNFDQMAGDITKGLSERFKMPDNLNGITRGLVKNMILQQEPNIPPHQLDILLDKWVPNPEKIRRGQEQSYPPEAIYSMADQFVQYGIGAMPASESAELKKLMPDWHEKYWNLFSPQLRTLIAETIKGEGSISEFRNRLRAHLRL